MSLIRALFVATGIVTIFFPSFTFPNGPRDESGLNESWAILWVGNRDVKMFNSFLQGSASFLNPFVSSRMWKLFEKHQIAAGEIKTIACAKRRLITQR